MNRPAKCVTLFNEVIECGALYSSKRSGGWSAARLTHVPRKLAGTDRSAKRDRIPITIIFFRFRCSGAGAPSYRGHIRSTGV